MSATSPPTWDRSALAKVLELDLRMPALTSKELQRGCDVARAHGLAAICVTSSRVLLAVHYLDESPVKVVCAVGSPTGAMDPDVKRYETEVAVDNGAHAIELTPNLATLRDADHAAFLRELRDVIEAADERDVGLTLDINALPTIDFPQVLGLVSDSGAKGLTLLGAGQGADLDAVRTVHALTGKGLSLKFERSKLAWEEVRGLVEAGVSRFRAARLEPLELR